MSLPSHTPRQPPRLWLLRHAQPLIAPGICYGQLDVPADAAATLQAAQALQQALPSGPSGPLRCALRHSPLQRCSQLAQHIACAQRSTDTRLQEMDFGSWEGQAWSAIDRHALDQWAQQLNDHAPGGGEPLCAMLARVRSALQDSWLHDSQRGTHDVVWVTHAGVIRCVHWLLQHGSAAPTSTQWNLPAPAFGQWHALDWAEIAARLNP